MLNTFLHFAIFVYQHKVVFNVRLSQGQIQKILFGINKHVHRHKQNICKYLHNGIMHNIGT